MPITLGQSGPMKPPRRGRYAVAPVVSRAAQYQQRAGTRAGPSIQRRRLQLREREKLIRSIADHMAHEAHGPMGIFLDAYKDIYDLVIAKQAWGLWDARGRGWALPIEWTRPS